ncbi:hypothetical protein F5I97DRAFT_1965248 [Phlebopus sp. FC_14]|nr:hypothetical protein F5I97DRAFT_1965248 [Phlebopus sp. FC_14]
MPRVSLLGLLVGTQLVLQSGAQTWCGKYYKPGESIVTPGGNFPLPAVSTDPLLAFQCAPAIRPYLAEDVSSPATVLIDSPVVYYQIANAVPISLPTGPCALTNDGMLNVTVSLDDRVLANGVVPLNATAFELSISLDGITPQMTPYGLTCEASYSATNGATTSSDTTQTFSATTRLSLLPNPTNSSVTKMDLRTGALLAKSASGQGRDYEPVFPIGFYTAFDDYLSTNLSVINELKDQGFTVIHPVPTFDNMTALDEVLDRMQEVGMYLMYDMRLSYMNATSVTEQVNAIKNRPNVLLWYTADEPDGTSDPLNATTIAYDLIYSLDGYHPVSLVLNCQDYYWPAYTAGTDIVLHDVFMVGTNVTFSNEWQTPCTPDFGDCGCDNCMSIPAGDTAAVPPNATYYGGPVPANSGIGSYFDISERGASFGNRLQVMGWERTKAVWTVPQGFGGEEYWVRAPTGEEWVLQSIMGINQGALGVVSWEDPTTADIKAAASAFAQSLPKITPFLFNPSSVRTTYVVGGVSVATWDTASEILVLATNTHYVNQTVSWEDVDVQGVGATAVFTSGVVEVSSNGFMLGAVGSGAFVMTT